MIVKGHTSEGVRSSMQSIADTPQYIQSNEQLCPQCKALMPVHPHYVTWCEQCDWNVKPQQSAKPGSAFDTLYTSIGKTSSQLLFTQINQATAIEPSLTITKALAFLFAAAIHTLTILFAILGIRLLIWGWPNFMAVIGGAICLGCAWVVRPRISKLPKDIVAREKCPALYQLVDRVAQALGTSSIDGIVLNWDFNAAFGQSGWRRRKILYLGIPLFAILDGQEQVAIIGHELAHSVNRDPTRSFVVGGAINSLVQWYSMLRPEHIWSRRHGVENIFMVPCNLLMFAVSQIVYLGMYLLSHLLWRDSQRAEYLADYLATQVAGTAAMLSALDKLHLRSALSLSIERVQKQEFNRKQSLDDLRATAASLPARELERVRRASYLDASRLDTTHPPTLHRVAFLKIRPISECKVGLLDAEAGKIARELSIA